MITGKLNLAALTHVEMEMEGQNGKVLGMFIPYDVNHVFKAEKSGARNIDIVAFDLKEPQTNKDGRVSATHMVKQSLPKDVREAMSDEEKRLQPIFGNLNTSQGSGATTDASVNPTPDKTFTPKDKLPF